MACTPVITKVAAGCTRNRLVYLITSGGGAGAGTTTKTNAQLLADIGDATSPLSILIRDTVCSSNALAWALAWNNPRINTEVQIPDHRMGTTGLAKPAISFLDDGGTDRVLLSVTSTDTDATGVYLVIEHRHSLGR